MRKFSILVASILFAVPAFAADHTVTIEGMKFSPPALSIAVGDTVTFVNQDSAPHTATAEGTFDTGRLSQGQSDQVTFDAAGSFAYVCTVHPAMKGTITVQ